MGTAIIIVCVLAALVLVGGIVWLVRRNRSTRP